MSEYGYSADEGRYNRGNSLTITVEILLSSMSLTIRLNEGRSNVVPENPSSMYSSSTAIRLSLANFCNIIRWV